MSHDKQARRFNPEQGSRNGLRRALGNRGFTLVELIVVSAILGVLTLMALPAYENIKERVRSLRATEEIRGIEKVINGYIIDKGGALPPDLSLATLGIAIPTDPWGRAYEYHPMVGGVAVDPDHFPARYGMFGLEMSQLNGDYDLYSTGKDGHSDKDVTVDISKDDIVRTGDGGFVGLAEDLSFKF